VKFSAFWSFALYLGVSTMLKAKRASCVRLERSKRGGKVLCVNWNYFLCDMRELHEVRSVFDSNRFQMEKCDWDGRNNKRMKEVSVRGEKKKCKA